MQLLFGRASGLGYRILVDQVREDNAASIGLHEKLGFESDRYAYKNKKDRNVFIYIKVLD